MTNYRNQHINPFITLLLGGLLFLLGACDSFNYEPVGEESSSNCRVRLYVSLMGGQSRDLSTRAQWDTPGVDFENYLDIGDFQVYIFGADEDGSEDGEGKLLAHLTDPAVKDAVELKIERANDYNDKYTITFRVDAVIEDAEEVLKNFKIVMLANWDNVYPTVKIGETTIDGMTSDLGNCVAKFDPNKSITKMPFFGVQEYSNVHLQSENVNTLLPSVDLLRAFAKIEVYDDPATELSTTEVKLKRYNTKFYKAPLKVTKSGDYKETAPALSLVDNYETRSEEDGEIDIEPDSRGHYIIYVPEYRNIGRSDGKKSSLLLTFEDGKEFTVDFKYYQKPASESNAKVGEYYDLRRNYWYEIIVKRTPILEVQVDVLPYTSVELKPNFGLLLDNLTLNKYVSKLYTDPQAATGSQDILIAYDENNKQITDPGKVNWRLSESVATHVCNITKNDDGTCTVKPIENATGRDVVEAVIFDKKGFEVIAECIIEVTERHLGLEKTFLGLIPKDILPAYSVGSFRVNIVAERDENSTLSWQLLDTNDQPLSADLQDLMIVTAEGDGGVLNSGENVSEKNITINVQANDQSKLGEVHLMLTYNGPDPDNLNDLTKRRDYTTYCDISVSNVSMTVYPTVLNLTVGQQSSVTARTAPVFSDYIPSLAFESLNTDVVTVDDNGLVTAVGVGKTQIKVSSNDDLLNWIAPQYVDVEVAPDDLVLLRYDGSPADHVELLSGEKFQLRAFSHGEDVSKKDECVWDVVDVSFLDKIENGVLTAGSKPGTSTVRATYTVNGISYSETCVVTVADKRKLVIADCPKGISPNASVPMRAYVFPDYVSYDKRNYTVTWTSSDVNIIAFDDPTDKSIAVAKNPGTATITATTKYNGVNLTAETKIDVLGHDQDIEPELFLYIKDSTGKKVKNINTEENVEYNNLDMITIPEGETWTAEVDFTDGNSVPNISCKWEKKITYSYHKERIDIVEDGKSCKITTKILPEDDHKSNRSNEVLLSFEYKNVKYTRKFRVYTKY